jgi:hypothetical protein
MALISQMVCQNKVIVSWQQFGGDENWQKAQ